MRKSSVLLRLAAVFAAVLALLWMLLALSACIPNEKIAPNMQKSAEVFRQTDTFTFRRGNRLWGLQDNYADAILLSVSWNMGEGSLPRAILDTGYFDDDERGINYGLYAAVNGLDAPMNVDYTRYVHGMAMPVRFLHLFTDVNGVRMIGMLTAVALAVVVGVQLARRRQALLCGAWAVSLCAVHMWDIVLAMEYQPAFIIAMLLSILTLALEKRGDDVLYPLFVAAGTMIAFFDFLTNETLVLLLPLVLLVGVRAAEERLGGFQKNIRVFALCAGCFGAAYAGVFLTKWTAATLATGENKFLLALSMAGDRAIGDAAPGNMPDSLILRILLAPVANLTVLFGGTVRMDIGRVAVWLFVVGMAALSLWYLFHKPQKDHTAAKLLLSLSAVLLVRYMLLSNHSYLHQFFTYRALATPILALLTGLILSAKGKEENKRKRR